MQNTCPKCGSTGAYCGFMKVECINETCDNFIKQKINVGLSEQGIFPLKKLKAVWTLEEPPKPFSKETQYSLEKEIEKIVYEDCLAESFNYANVYTGPPDNPGDPIGKYVSIETKEQIRNEIIDALNDRIYDLLGTNIGSCSFFDLLPGTIERAILDKIITIDELLAYVKCNIEEAVADYEFKEELNE